MSCRCLLLGEAGVGKTSLVNCYLSQPWAKTYRPTEQLTEHLIETLIDGSGQLKRLYLLDGWHVLDEPSQPIDCVIIIFDVHNFASYLSLTNYYQQVRERYGLTCPIIFAGNKIDIFGRLIESTDLNRLFAQELVNLTNDHLTNDHLTHDYQFNLLYCDLSVKTRLQTDVLLNYLLKLTLQK